MGFLCSLQSSAGNSFIFLVRYAITNMLKSECNGMQNLITEPHRRKTSCSPPRSCSPCFCVLPGGTGGGSYVNQDT